MKQVLSAWKGSVVLLAILLLLTLPKSTFFLTTLKSQTPIRTKILDTVKEIKKCDYITEAYKQQAKIIVMLEHFNIKDTIIPDSLKFSYKNKNR